MWKLCGKAQFPESFGRFDLNYAKTTFPQNFQTRKLGEIAKFYAVKRVQYVLKHVQHLQEKSRRWSPSLNLTVKTPKECHVFFFASFVHDFDICEVQPWS